MISGRQALGEIERAIAQLRGDEDRLGEALRGANDQAARLRAERMEGFRELARIKLDALTRDSVLGELDAAEKRALALLGDRRGALAELALRRRQAEDVVRRAEADRHEAAARLEAAIAAFEAERKRALEIFRAGPEWQAAKAAALSAATVAEEADKKAAQAEADREAKRRPYEEDPLFSYLWQRRFGTAEYRAGPLTRFLDRAVARLVGFAEARANYWNLNEIPTRLREHAERVKGEIAGAEARLAAAEPPATSERQAREDAVLAAKKSLEAVEALLARDQAGLAALDAEHEAAFGGDDPASREAIEILAAADSRQDLGELLREAQATPTPADEAVLRGIQATETAIGAAERGIGEARKAMREAAQRRLGIERERDAFRRRGYDNPWGQFGNEQMLGNVLGGILGGVLQSTVLRDVLRDNYQRRDRSGNSDFGGGFQFPFPTDRGSWSRGGSWGGGEAPDAGDLFGEAGPFGQSSGGGNDGGDDDFRTGGSF